MDEQEAQREIKIICQRWRLSAPKYNQPWRQKRMSPSSWILYLNILWSSYRSCWCFICKPGSERGTNWGLGKIKNYQMLFEQSPHRIGDSIKKNFSTLRIENAKKRFIRFQAMHLDISNPLVFGSRLPYICTVSCISNKSQSCHVVAPMA